MSDANGRGRRAAGVVHGGLTRILSLAMLLIGIGLIVRAAAGAAAYAAVLGVFFAAAGAGRLYIQARRARPPDG